MVANNHGPSKANKPKRFPIVTLADGRQWAVDRCGLVDPDSITPESEPADPDEIVTAAQWLQERIGNDSGVKGPTYSSYELKHSASRWARRYIANGAFIIAAYRLGYAMRPARRAIGIRNAIIGISKRVYQNLPESQRKEVTR